MKSKISKVKYNIIINNQIKKLKIRYKTKIYQIIKAKSKYKIQIKKKFKTLKFNFYKKAIKIKIRKLKLLKKKLMTIKSIIKYSWMTKIFWYLTLEKNKDLNKIVQMILKIYLTIKNN